MAHKRRAEADSGLYGRLLQRLALALEEAESAARLGQAVPHELELRGLSAAELQLIQAYLQRDLNWLQGWHAAAQQLAALQQSPAARAVEAALPLAAPEDHLALCCALCNTRVAPGVQACGACGGQLFRPLKPSR